MFMAEFKNPTISGIFCSVCLAPKGVNYLFEQRS